MQALISQLKEDKVYQEGRHWRRVRQIGSGGSGQAFCIEDFDSQLCLALKEVISPYSEKRPPCNKTISL